MNIKKITIETDGKEGRLAEFPEWYKDKWRPPHPVASLEDLMGRIWFGELLLLDLQKVITDWPNRDLAEIEVEFHFQCGVVKKARIRSDSIHKYEPTDCQTLCAEGDQCGDCFTPWFGEGQW